jgi:hypothetical protein
LPLPINNLTASRSSSHLQHQNIFDQLRYLSTHTLLSTDNTHISINKHQTLCSPSTSSQSSSSPSSTSPSPSTNTQILAQSAVVSLTYQPARGILTWYLHSSILPPRSCTRQGDGFDHSPRCTGHTTVSDAGCHICRGSGDFCQRG